MAGSGRRGGRSSRTISGSTLCLQSILSETSLPSFPCLLPTRPFSSPSFFPPPLLFLPPSFLSFFPFQFYRGSTLCQGYPVRADSLVAKLLVPPDRAMLWLARALTWGISLAEVWKWMLSRLPGTLAVFFFFSLSPRWPHKVNRAGSVSICFM